MVVERFHSALRWAKPWKEIEEQLTEAGVDVAMACTAEDPKNGNRAVHIAAQNCHQQLLEELVNAGADLDVRNAKGQTPLHMAVEYDFYFVAKFMIDHGADKDLENNDGHKAVLGIDGLKSGAQAWNNVVTILKAALTEEQMAHAFAELDKAIATAPESIDKGELVQAGMTKKRCAATKEKWDHKRFLALAGKL